MLNEKQPPDQALPLQFTSKQDRQVDSNNTQLGEGYGLPTKAMLEAVWMLARKDWLLLDPVYSGKPFTGRTVVEQTSEDERED